MGDWPFSQLKAKACCGTVTTLTRTEFSITFLGFSSASRAGFQLPVQLLRKAGRINYEGWNGFYSRSSGSRAHPRGRICQPEIDPALIEFASAAHRTGLRTS